jgi:hypothetical protein
VHIGSSISGSTALHATSFVRSIPGSSAIGIWPIPDRNEKGRQQRHRRVPRIRTTSRLAAEEEIETEGFRFVNLAAMRALPEGPTSNPSLIPTSRLAYDPDAVTPVASLETCRFSTGRRCEVRNRSSRQKPDAWRSSRKRFHHCNDDDVRISICSPPLATEVAMKNLRGYRAMSILCRQKAALHPTERSAWLSYAERWEQLAEAEIAEHFKACNTDYPQGNRTARGAASG